VAWLEDELRESRAGMAKLAQALEQSQAEVWELRAALHRTEDTVAAILPQLTAIPRIDGQLPQIKDSVGAVQQHGLGTAARVGELARLIDANAERDRGVMNEFTRRLDGVERQGQGTGARLDVLDDSSRRTMDAITLLRQRADEVVRSLEALEARVGRVMEASTRSDGEFAHLAAEIEGLRKQDEVTTERVQRYAEMIKRLDGQIALVAAEVAVKQDIVEKMELSRVETHRLEERISVVEAAVSNLRDQDDELVRQTSHLDGRQKGYQDRLAGLLADLAVHRAQTADQFQRLHQLHERLTRRHIEDLERDLREMRIHAFRSAEEQ
jgi:chromosome segregation ATPase